MSLCTCVCMYIYCVMCICVCVYMHLCIHVYRCVHVYIVCICMYVYTVCMYMCMCVCACACVYMCPQMPCRAMGLGHTCTWGLGLGRAGLCVPGTPGLQQGRAVCTWALSGPAGPGSGPQRAQGQDGWPRSLPGLSLEPTMLVLAETTTMGEAPEQVGGGKEGVGGEGRRW